MRGKKGLAVLMTSMVLLSGCGKSTSTSALKVYNDYELQSREYTTLNYLNTNSSVDFQVAVQFVDGLVEQDNKGNIIPCLATKWEHNDDSTVWTFDLRKNVKWLTRDGKEYEAVTADDFVESVKYALDAKNASTNQEMITSVINGASEFASMSADGEITEDNFDEKFDEMVGVKAIDDYTVEYTMNSPKPYFDTVITYAAYYPVNGDYLDEIGVENFGIDPDNLLYNGCYLMGDYALSSYKTYVKNEKYWDKDNVPFDRVNVTMLESLNRAFEMFNTGELDRAVLTQDTAITELANNNDNLVETKTNGYAYSLYFNYDQADNPDWNTAVQNKNFRKAWYYGVDVTNLEARTNPKNPEVLDSQTYTSTKLVKTSDGTDYTKLDELKEFTGEGVDQYQPSKAADYKAKAMEELSAQGVTFPIRVGIAYHAGDQTAEETFQVQKATFEESLGTDFIEVYGISYIKSSRTEITTPRLQSISISAWGADYGDPFNYLYQMTSNDDVAMNKSLSHLVDTTYDKMVDDANAIVDLDERYHAFASCEAYLLENAYVVPLYTGGHEFQVTRVNDYSKPSSRYGVCDRKIKYWETQKDAYTAKEYEELEKAYEGSK